MSVESSSKIPGWLPSFSAAAMAGGLFGYDIGSSSSVIRVLGDQGFDASQLSAVASISLLGALVSSIAVNLLGNRFGRKSELQVAYGIYFAGTCLQFISSGFWSLVTGRFIYGLGIGAAMHASPLLISESVPSDKRGSLVALKEAFIVFGILMGYVSGYVLSPLGTESWRYMFAAALLLEVPGAIVAASSQESPRFLCLQASKGPEYEHLLREAEQSQYVLNGGDRDQATREIGDILQNVRDNQSQRGVGLLETPGAKPALISGVGLVLFQQVTGQPSVLYYANRIFDQAGLGFGAAVGVGVFKLVSTVGSAYSVERFGRKPLLIAGTSIMTACLAALSFIFSGIQPDAPFTSSQQVAIISAVILYVGGYQIGFGPISWLMLSELFPLQVRSKALALGTISNFGSNLLVAALFEPLRESIGSSSLFAIFAIISLSAILFESLYLSETKGKSLEEIEDMMRARDKPSSAI